MAGRDIDIPPAGVHLWEWFWDAHKGRQMGPSSLQNLPSAEWLAWSALAGQPVLPTEWRILRDMDGALISAIAENASNTRPPSSDQEFTPEVFDAVFGP